MDIQNVMMILIALSAWSYCMNLSQPLASLSADILAYSSSSLCSWVAARFSFSLHSSMTAHIFPSVSLNCWDKFLFDLRQAFSSSFKIMPLTRDDSFHPLCFFFFLSIGPIRLSIGMIHMNYKSSCFLWITNLYGTNRSCRWKKPTSCAVALQHSLQGQPQTQCKQIAAIIDHRTNHNTEGEAQKKKSATEWYKRKKERTTKKK